MKTKKIQKELTKRTFANLDGIYKAAQNTCKSWGVEDLPLITLKQTVAKAKLKTNTEVAAVNEYNVVYNKVLDSMVETLEQGAKANKLTAVPLPRLKGVIDIIKVNIKAGAK